MVTPGGPAPQAALRAVLGPAEPTPCRALFAGTDWATTAIGAPETWSPTLRSAISTAMNTRFGMLVMAGPELVMVYNDAYAPLMGALHPAMGRPLPEVWADEWPTLAPMVEQVVTEQVANHFEDFLLMSSRNGFLEETYFTFSYSPLIDADGEVVGLLDTVLETTERVLATRRLQLAQQLGQTGAARHDDLGAAVAAVVEVLAEHRTDLPLAGVHLLTDVDDPGSPLLLHGGHGVPAVAPGTAEEAWLRTALSDRQTAEDFDGRWGAVPAEIGDGPVRTAVALPLTPPGRSAAVGVLVLGLSPHLVQDQAYRTFQELVANQVAGVLGDTLAHLAERAAAETSRTMSEALQRSLLTDPVEPEHLHIAVRYRPATTEAEIGGDWYDAFRGQDGATWLVVGDVAGHDQSAAAVMAQVRNLLRGIAFTQHSPARVLEALDAAMAGLGVDRLTSAVVVRVEPEPTDGVHRLRWSNAGHPPPLLVPATGGAVPVGARVERILGAVPGSPRTDHDLDLRPGDGLLLYTDGLVERRTGNLDDAQAWLVGHVVGLRGLPLAQLCDELIAVVTDHAEDDIALLALRSDPHGG
ncbi:hypothetical protein GCM10023162_13990 [Klenkia terrae]